MAQQTLAASDERTMEKWKPPNSMYHVLADDVSSLQFIPHRPRSLDPVLGRCVLETLHTINVGELGFVAERSPGTNQLVNSSPRARGLPPTMTAGRLESCIYHPLAA
jgi:hypothetical protein